MSPTLILSLSHISAPPARAEELYTMLIRNIPNAIRTLIMRGGIITTLIAYSKVRWLLIF